MPVIRPSGRKGPLASVRDHLADMLVNELMGERVRRGPVIFELPTDRKNQIDVIVMWEEWKSVPVAARNEVVREAYRRFEKIIEAGTHHIDPALPREPLVPTPALVIAGTWEDLTTNDFLPYKIIPSRRAGEDIPEDVYLMMIDAGAVWTPFGHQLLFPTEEMAVDALARLNKDMPEVGWSLVGPSFGPNMG